MILPEDFVKRTREMLGDEYPDFEKALSENLPTSIRVNDKMSYWPTEEKVAWCDSGYYLPERPLFTADPLFHAGVYYVQEASSMFLSQAVKQFFPDASTVLDLCAAPGGKSTLLSQTLSRDSLLVCNEIIRSRAYILAENIIKWGNPNVVVSNNEPKDFDKLTDFFDAVVIDAPCSGEGMFRKDSGAVQEWSLSNVQLCAERQREILHSVWDALKTDGILVYSTCTFNREENEENVRWICEELGAELLRLDLNGNKDITVSDFGYRFYPHKTKGEGLFLSVMRKTSESERKLKLKIGSKKSNKSTVKADLKLFRLLDAEKWEIVSDNNRILAYDKQHYSNFTLLTKQLHCLHSGVELGEIKGKDFIPAPSVALSKILDRDSVVEAEVDYETAIAYLKREAIQLPDVDRGYVLITFKGQALGWVKNLGNRCNNLYPSEWRIRMNL